MQELLYKKMCRNDTKRPIFQGGHYLQFMLENRPQWEKKSNFQGQMMQDLLPKKISCVFFTQGRKNVQMILRP